MLGTAFPCTKRNDDGSPYLDHTGMTLRDGFAGQVLSTVFGSRGPSQQPPGNKLAGDDQRVGTPRLGEGRRHCYEADRKLIPALHQFTQSEGISMVSLRSLAPLAFALVLGLPAVSHAQSFNDAQKSEIQKIIKDYLVANPELLEEMSAELQKRQAAAEAEKHRVAVQRNADVIFNSPRGVVIGNRDGDVNFVEFFDYNCPYCKHAMADMLSLMKSDSKLRVVLKEFPVLGPGSVEAAQVAVAVRMQDPTGKKYLDFHQKLLSGRGQPDKARAMAAAKEAGLDMAKLEKDLASPEINATLNENFKLAEEMGLNGTPSYVIGKEVVVGAVGAAGLAKKISEARCGKATC